MKYRYFVHMVESGVMKPRRLSFMIMSKKEITTGEYLMEFQDHCRKCIRDQQESEDLKRATNTLMIENFKLIATFEESEEGEQDVNDLSLGYVEEK